ncbi:hypothetical protein JFL75_00850 [Breznakiella homolactica]|uniref:Uncharacterized protein n=1 Tax=Breznakiella homolactica TaxID=2798577 RepID=A0A7T8BAY8_9SPIR|nr:hypothetical protein JFL75_00850 [Breznakiella homolactica]
MDPVQGGLIQGGPVRASGTGIVERKQIFVIFRIPLPYKRGIKNNYFHPEGTIGNGDMALKIVYEKYIPAGKGILPVLDIVYPRSRGDQIYFQTIMDMEIRFPESALGIQDGKGKFRRKVKILFPNRVYGNSDPPAMANRRNLPERRRAFRTGSGVLYF